MITFQNVAKIYPPDKTILRDVSFHISRGDFIALGGEVGSGKSLLIRMILCLEKPTKGQVVIFGRNSTALRQKEIPFLRRRIGYISQEIKFMRPRTVLENLVYVLNAQGIFGILAEQRAKATLTAVELGGLMNTFPSDLSRSQQQKLMIARALVVQPSIILADEPLSFLSKPDCQLVTQLLMDANKEGTVIIWAAHEKDEFLQNNKKIREFLLQEGKVQVIEPVPTTENPTPHSEVIK